MKTENNGRQILISDADKDSFKIVKDNGLLNKNIPWSDEHKYAMNKHTGKIVSVNQKGNDIQYYDAVEGANVLENKSNFLPVDQQIKFQISFRRHGESPLEVSINANSYHLSIDNQEIQSYPPKGNHNLAHFTITPNEDELKKLFKDLDIGKNDIHNSRNITSAKSVEFVGTKDKIEKIKNELIRDFHLHKSKEIDEVSQIENLTVNDAIGNIYKAKGEFTQEFAKNLMGLLSNDLSKEHDNTNLKGVVFDYYNMPNKLFHDVTKYLMSNSTPKELQKINNELYNVDPNAFRKSAEHQEFITLHQKLKVPTVEKLQQIEKNTKKDKSKDLDI